MWVTFRLDVPAVSVWQAAGQLTPRDTGGSHEPVKIKPGTTWGETWARCVGSRARGVRLGPAAQPDRRRVAPGRDPGRPRHPDRRHPDPGPAADRRREEAEQAVAYAVGSTRTGAEVDLDERRARVPAAVDALTAHRDLLALLLVWEIGKPWRLACADVDRGAGRGALVRRTRSSGS